MIRFGLSAAVKVFCEKRVHEKIFKIYAGKENRNYSLKYDKDHYFW